MNGNNNTIDIKEGKMNAILVQNTYVEEQPSFHLPKTGAEGTEVYWFLGAGTLVLALAGVAVLYKRRKKAKA